MINITDTDCLALSKIFDLLGIDYSYHPGDLSSFRISGSDSESQYHVCLTRNAQAFTRCRGACAADVANSGLSTPHSTVLIWDFKLGNTPFYHVYNPTKLSDIVIGCSEDEYPDDSQSRFDDLMSWALFFHRFTKAQNLGLTPYKIRKKLKKYKKSLALVTNPTHPGLLLRKAFQVDAPGGDDVVTAAFAMCLRVNEAEALFRGEIPISDAIACCLRRNLGWSSAKWRGLQIRYDQAQKGPR